MSYREEPSLRTSSQNGAEAVVRIITTIVTERIIASEAPSLRHMSCSEAPNLRNMSYREEQSLRTSSRNGAEAVVRIITKIVTERTIAMIATDAAGQERFELRALVLSLPVPSAGSEELRAFAEWTGRETL
eukprot:1282560-Rhodomonas_salina.1